MKLGFSSRLPEDLSDSPFFLQLSALKRKVGTWTDLTVSTPLSAGIPFDLDSVLSAASGNFSVWNPDSSGWLQTREAVARYFAERGGSFDVEHIQLTASTSEAYSILFKTLCNPGDAILTPVPGYPLLDSLAALEFLKTFPYFLICADGKWRLDSGSLCAFPPQTKILLIVSPNNPTGHVFSKEEWNAAVEMASRENWAIVVDEVFGDFIYDGTERPWNWDSKDVPVFFLGGLSKSVGSPQLKLGWMAYRPGRLGARLKETVEYVADAYLSVSSPAFALATPMLSHSLEYEAKIQKRICDNLSVLRSVFGQVEVVPNVQGGWYAALHFDGEEDDVLTLRLFRKHGILVQPGFLFDFPEDGWIVVSLLTETFAFEQALRKIAQETRAR